MIQVNKGGRPASPKSRFRLIAERLREAIRSGTWKPGDVVPSLRELARTHRVGQRVIRMAIDVLKSEGCIATNVRRRLVVKRLVDASATTTSFGTVLELTSRPLHEGLDSPLLSELQRGIEKGAGDLGSPLFIAHGDHLRFDLPDELLDISPRGIVMAGVFEKRCFRAYERLNVPVVMIDRPDRHWKLHAASVDNVGSSFDATNRLLAMGHRRIALLRFLLLRTKVFDPDSIEREKGFLRAMGKARIPKPKNYLFSAYSQVDPTKEAIQSILTATPRFTAVLAADPACAQVVMLGARNMGLSIPKDLSVACFQGKVPDRPEISGPRIDFEDLSRRAMQLLKYPRLPKREIRIPATWYDGKTTGPPRN